MTGTLILSPRARRDLDEVWDYSRNRWGEVRAEAYVRQLARDMRKVADNPRLGRTTEQVRSGYRRFGSGSHVLFYRVTDIGITVIRILHERMDVTRHL
jgi:toxin ParE1/3/4